MVSPAILWIVEYGHGPHVAGILMIAPNATVVRASRFSITTGMERAAFIHLSKRCVEVCINIRVTILFVGRPVYESYAVFGFARDLVRLLSE
jgi:hypothetical protein